LAGGLHPKGSAHGLLFISEATKANYITKYDDPLFFRYMCISSNLSSTIAINGVSRKLKFFNGTRYEVLLPMALYPIFIRPIRLTSGGMYAILLLPQVIRVVVTDR
jgi:hypothetical protein